LTRVIREVNDLLIHGETLEELVEQLEAFFNFCELYNITLAPKKSLIFAGFDMSAEGLAQDLGTMDAIRKFRKPESKQQLKSWLG
jgi:hypothetical protein